MAQYQQDNFSLYTPTGDRKYVNATERDRVLVVLEGLARDRALFSLLLAWTGARVSEALSVTAASFDLERSVVALRTLKRRKHHVREVPIQPSLMSALDRQFRLRELQQNPRTSHQRLWSFGRITAWRFVKAGMLHAGVIGKRATPKTLRHSFAVSAITASIPLHIVQKWLGHARLSTTAIYAAVVGPEEMVFAEKLWRTASRQNRSRGAGEPAPSIQGR